MCAPRPHNSTGRMPGRWTGCSAAASTRPPPDGPCRFGDGGHPRFGLRRAGPSAVVRLRHAGESVHRVGRGAAPELRALASVAENAGATAPERANAEALKKRLEEKLRAAGAPAGDWTDNAFRLGRWAKEMRKSAPPAPSKEDWTDNAHRLGKAVRRGYKKWLSD